MAAHQHGRFLSALLALGLDSVEWPTPLRETFVKGNY